MLETVPSLPFVAESISVHPHMTISLELKVEICLGVCGGGGTLGWKLRLKKAMKLGELPRGSDPPAHRPAEWQSRRGTLPWKIGIKKKTK